MVSMQMQLKDRLRQIPNGFRFYQPETKWDAPKWMSFDSLVRAVISHRLGNLSITKTKGLATDYASVADEVEQYNVKLCLAQGWTDFLAEGLGGGSVPKTQPLLSGQKPSVAAAGARIVAGLKTIKDLLGGDPVPKEQAETRASQCIGCPRNVVEDLTSFFTIPAARQIQGYIVKTKQAGYKTSHDDQLGVCEACSCPLKLKVHTPLEFIAKHMPEEVKNSLVKECWVLNEK